MSETDVIVVGAGLAGAAAALKLARAGKRVRLIEARPRCGGRGYLKPFAGDGQELEFGGAWITPWHGRLRALVAEHGLSLRPRHPVTNRLWLRGGALHADGAAAPDEVTAHERAIARVAADAILLKKGMAENERGEALTGISFAAYLDRLSCPKPTRDLFSAWWTVSGSGDHAEVAASEFLASCSYDNGLAEGMINFWSDTVVPGMGVLAQRMIAASGAELVLSAPVEQVASTGAGVELTAGEARHRASACVLALGINQLRALHFAPELSAPKREAIARGHGGRAFKLWIRMQGVPVGTLVTGDGNGIEFAFAERLDEDGSTLVVAFGLTRDGNRPADPQWVKGQAGKLFPNARVLAHDWHDWVDDPFARGTWVSALAGHEAGLDAANWQPESRIAFASSDYARDQAGWFEGAVIAGEDAAEAVLKLT
ncbi:flavin monoamine oxidase family protein [Aestuariivirga sp.]|uniref:flavin monoamine oxidase family protein n=1 Tax=Aestuariivirga sp. TaxID=2650926 RepID=UPI003918D43B